MMDDDGDGKSIMTMRDHWTMMITMDADDQRMMSSDNGWLRWCGAMMTMTRVNDDG